MFNDQVSVIQSDNNSQPFAPSHSGPNLPKKKTLIILGIVIAIILIGFIILKFSNFRHNNVDTNSTKEVVTIPISPSLNLPNTPKSEIIPPENNKESFDSAIEYISFSDFYKPFDNNIDININNYELPLDAKIDVMNYYDVSRKVDLDPGLDTINNSGFAIINNPWKKDIDDFYSIYNKLDDKQLPLLITSDFIIYYNQNMLKKSFKDIEENVFYDNLWDINTTLYNKAKLRYESRLSKIGGINDSILEGERLEVAYFATALELLKPTKQQIASQNMPDDNLFNNNEVNKYYFVVPPYLRDDVLHELELIKAAKGKIKSPVLLYDRDYSKFSVPSEYKSQVKLYNFYLTTVWLNSIFPLNYQDDNCSDCLLDKEDWRINLITASLIATDFSNSANLKSEWARIYKLISYFKGLRDDLNYVYYRDSLVKLFGKDYDIEQLFSDKNVDYLNNLEKLRHELLQYSFASIRGAWDKKDSKDLGFRMLADYYWPNDFIFNYLVYPNVKKYKGKIEGDNNVTACYIKNIIRRCNGIALDVINLIHPVVSSNYFLENINYDNYQQQSNDLRKKLLDVQNNHDNNYWSTLAYIKKLVEIDKEKMPIFMANKDWQKHSLDSAVSSWINFQLPVNKFTVNKFFNGQGLDKLVKYSKHSYIEPNLNLVNELIADNNMLLKMFSALKIDYEVNSAIINIQKVNSNLNVIKVIIEKELEGKPLDANDNEAITNFSKELIVYPNKKDHYLNIKSSAQKDTLKEDLSHLKLLVLVHKDGDNKVFTIGPVWDYQESH